MRCPTSRLSASLTALHSSSPARLSIRTNQPAVQLYSCNGQNYLTPRKASHGGPAQGYGPRSCIVLEQEGRIDGIRQPQWGEDQVYDDERPYEWWSEYSFSTL